jgi:cyclophilin family peptidyl-prolyl cis-trans isomerase
MKTLVIIGAGIAIIILALVLRGNAKKSDSDESPLPSTPNIQQVDTIQEGNTTSPETTSPLSTDTSSKKTMEHYTQATLTTSAGTIVIELDRERTPHTVQNFVTLASSGFYNGTRFHRVIKDFMIQGGDPLSKDDTKQAYWGTGGPGYQFADEIGSTNSNAVGTIAMANAGPNTNGSQFFINVADNSFLNTKHTVFGKVIKGYDIVEKMSTTKTGPQDRPVEPITITSITLQ